MWPEYLVPTKTVEIDVEQFDINGPMGDPGNAVHGDDAARDGMNETGQLSDRMYRPHHVGNVIASDDACFGSQKRPE